MAQTAGTALALIDVMGQMAVLIELIHAVAILAWIAGLPLLFWHRWPRLTRWYAGYALVFVVLTQGSRMLLGECFLTTIARHLFESAAPETVPAEIHEWFTVRFAKWVFGFAPTRRSIVLLFEAGVAITAIGALVTLSTHRWHTRRS
jgi:hypothetical protein